MAKVALIKSCIARIPVYLLSFIKLPKWAVKVNKLSVGCLWDDYEGDHKYHLVAWGYLTDEGKLWKTVIDFKLITAKPNIFNCKVGGFSRFFKGLMAAVNAAKLGFRRNVSNRKSQILGR